MIIALSGAIISYHDEIIDAINGDITHISKINRDAKRIETDKILSKISQDLPNFKLASYQISSDENKAFMVAGAVQDDGKMQMKSFFINPYTGEIIGENRANGFISIVLNLHSNLGFAFFGKNGAFIGKQIVAFSTVALILLLISGVVLYYPKIKRRFFSSLKINFKKHGYAFLYSLHSVVGMWAFLFLFIISSTGLYFSYDFIMSGVNKAFGEKEIFRKNLFDVRPILLNEQNIAKLSSAVEIFRKDRNHNYEFGAFTPTTKGFVVFYIDKNSDETKANLMTIDVENKEITANIRAENGVFANFKTKNKVNDKEQSYAFLITGFMLNLHSGYIFGEIGKFLFFISSLSVLLFTITGLMMSIKRVFRK